MRRCVRKVYALLGTGSALDTEFYRYWDNESIETVCDMARWLHKSGHKLCFLTFCDPFLYLRDPRFKSIHLRIPTQAPDT